MKKMLLFAFTAVVLSAAVPVNQAPAKTGPLGQAHALIVVPPPCGDCLIVVPPPCGSCVR
jgi:hypothetical protein